MKVTKLRIGYRWHLSDGQHAILKLLLPQMIEPMLGMSRSRLRREVPGLDRGGTMALNKLIAMRGHVDVGEDRRNVKRTKRPAKTA